MFYIAAQITNGCLFMQLVKPINGEYMKKFNCPIVNVKEQLSWSWLDRLTGQYKLSCDFCASNMHHWKNRQPMTLFLQGRVNRISCWFLMPLRKVADINSVDYYYPFTWSVKVKVKREFLRALEQGRAGARSKRFKILCPWERNLCLSLLAAVVPRLFCPSAGGGSQVNFRK